MAVQDSPIVIDPSLVSDRIERMARYGPHPEAGMRRLVYTPAWSAAVAELGEWLQSDGMDVRRDAVGNIYGVVAGTEPGPSIITGSHIDTTVQGGKYDGTLGVIAASIAVRSLKQGYGQPRRTLEVLATCDEEASRFHSNFWGARAIAGLVGADEADHIRDSDGITLADAMRSVGLDPADVRSAHRTDIDTFLELHIEQGPVLDRFKIPLAAVEAITGVRQQEFTLLARADHAGSTPMAERLDAAPALAEVIQQVTQMALDFGPPAVSTIGRIETFPGFPNIVAARIRFSVDSRYHSEAKRQEYNQRIDRAIAKIAADAGLGLRSENLLDQPAVPMDPSLVDTIRSSADALGIPYRTLVSGAGHDTQVIARSGVKTAMIFVASKNGRSHSPDEFTTLDDCVAGISVLTETLRRLAYD